ncbi:hypothetical protein FB451DRAFT_1471379 [Mycena latifolia]|nr:hypothetical protein FB451DRAFT_1471379 [Mycena latifolia]
MQEAIVLTALTFTVSDFCLPTDNHGGLAHNKGILSKLRDIMVGKLVLRKKKKVQDTRYSMNLTQKTAPVNNEHPVKQLLPADVTEIYYTLVSSGIKVRDFAYAPNQIGHLNPVDEIDPGSLTYLENYYARLKDPPPPIPDHYSRQWTETDPRLMPPQPVLMSNHPVQVPTPDAPFVPLYPTHRITSKFHQRDAMLEHDYRLSEDPRTRPIRGITSRRLLALGPGWVDLSRYAQMDINALWEYDCILFEQSQDTGVYPWVPAYEVFTPPTLEEREAWRQYYEQPMQRRDARWAAEEKRHEMTEASHERKESSCHLESGRSLDDQENVCSPTALRYGKKRARENNSAEEGTGARPKRQRISRTLAAKASAVTGPSKPRKKRRLDELEQAAGEAAAPESATSSPRKKRRLRKVEEAETETPTVRPRRRNRV